MYPRLFPKDLVGAVSVKLYKGAAFDSYDNDHATVVFAEGNSMVGHIFQVEDQERLRQYCKAHGIHLLGHDSFLMKRDGHVVEMRPGLKPKQLEVVRVVR